MRVTKRTTIELSLDILSLLCFILILRLLSSWGWFQGWGTNALALLSAGIVLCGVSLVLSLVTLYKWKVSAPRWLTKYYNE